MKYQREETQHKNKWGWIIGGIVGYLILASIWNGSGNSNNPQFPMDDQNLDDSLVEQEYLEGKAELETLKNDPCAYDIYLGVPEEYRRCDSGTENEEYSTEINAYSSNNKDVKKIYACVNASSLNVRNGPGTNYSASNFLMKNDCIYLIERNHDGSWVKYKGGWVSAYYLNASENIDTLPITNQTTNRSITINSDMSNNSETSTCICTYNAYNCKDFRTQQEAQECYRYCLSKVGTDIHWLDEDSDGIACELNP